MNAHSISLVGNDVIIGADFAILTDGIFALDNLELGINEVVQQHVEMYPNPAKEKVIFTNDSNSPLSFELLTINGVVVQTGIIGVGISTLDVQYLSEGMYFVNIGGKELRKLIVKK